MAAGSDVVLTAVGGMLLSGSSVVVFLHFSQHCNCGIDACLLCPYMVCSVCDLCHPSCFGGIGDVVSVAPVIAIAFALDIYWVWRQLQLGVSGTIRIIHFTSFLELCNVLQRQHSSKIPCIWKCLNKLLSTMECKCGSI